MRYFALMLGVALAVATPAISGEKKKAPDGFPLVERGPEHKVLEGLVGTWDAKVKLFLDPMKPLESTGVMKRTMILGGNFLQESFSGEIAGKKFAGLGLIGYDYNKDKFLTTWCDSMSTSMAITQGDFDSKKKILTSVGEEFEQNTKKTMKVRDVLRIVSADEQIFERFALPPGEKDYYKMMEVRYTRQK